MLAKRIIPCLDVRNGRTVKGTHFEGLRDAGDPVAMAEAYSLSGADELVFLDISATLEGRSMFMDVVRAIAERIRIPFTVGGGIRSAEDVLRALDAGADKVALNSAIVERPGLIDECATTVGSQSIVAAIDARGANDRWSVRTRSGTRGTDRDVVEWSREVTERGAGEILLTSMDRDGTAEGYDTRLLAAVSSNVGVPVIASGGAGTIQHMVDALTLGKADAILAASIFHFGTFRIMDVKTALADRGIVVRITD